MTKHMLTNDVFAIRDEVFVAYDSEQAAINHNGATCVLAVMLRTVEFPPGKIEPVRTADSAPVEARAVVSCKRNPKGRWQWLPLSAPSKEAMGDYLFDGCEATPDRWYFVAFYPHDDMAANQ